MKIFVLFLPFVFLACFLESPVEETKAPSEVEYCKWLIEELYFDSLPELNASTPESLFAQVKDPYTRYVPPPKADDSHEQTMTSNIPGSIGLELALVQGREFPLIASRVYPRAPAERAGLKRYAQILKINEISLSGSNAANLYTAELAISDSVYLEYVYNADTLVAAMKKEKVLAPTVFLDTLSSGIRYITLRRFTAETIDETNGTWGELQTILNELPSNASPTIIDIRGNPGGLVSQCNQAADLFIPNGLLYQIKEHELNNDGNGKTILRKTYASNLGSESKGNFWLFTNEGTASCAEVFEISLLRNSQNVHSFGVKTFGKGIGQVFYNTPAGGIVYISSMVIYDNKGETYHKSGIEPDFACEAANSECLNSLFEFLNAKNILAKKQILKSELELYDHIIFENDYLGGAIAE